MTPEVCQSAELLSALFHHECCRVIADRFIDSSDRQTFHAIMENVCFLESARWVRTFLSDELLATYQPVLPVSAFFVK